MYDLSQSQATTGMADYRLQPFYFSEDYRHKLYTPLKRGFDLVLAIALSIVLAPLVLVAGALIKLTSKGPVFFQQIRIGRHGEPFRFWKLRTMVVEAEHLRHSLATSDQQLFKLDNDPRVTTIGKLLRALSIDELPQLWNVIKGDMSLVGPRPALPMEVAYQNAYQRLRLAVLPGITCLWQIRGRSALSFDDQVALDLEYIQKRSVIFDLAVLLRTIPAVFLRRGSC